MTSWIRVQPKRKSDGADPVAEKSFMYLTSEDEPAAVMLDLLYCHMYASGQGAPLYVYDQTNPVSPSVGLYATTFQDVSGVSYVDTRRNGPVVLNSRPNLLIPYISALNPAAMRSVAESFFNLKGEAMKQVTEAMRTTPLLSVTKNGPLRSSATAPAYYDAGIYVRSGPVTGGRSTAPPVLPYLAALREHAKKAGLTTMNIFVMTNSEEVLTELKRGGEAGWTFYAFRALSPPMGASARTAARFKQDSFVQMLAELAMVQNCPHIVVPLASALGRFVYLTAAEGSTVRGIDQRVFSAFMGS